MLTDLPGGQATLSSGASKSKPHPHNHELLCTAIARTVLTGQAARVVQTTIFGHTLMCCFRRTHWGWLTTLACSGWSILPVTIYGGLVRGMQARLASTGTESFSSSTRTSLQPMTSCQMTSRWTRAHAHLPHSAAAAVAILSNAGALCGHAGTARHGWS